jgi:hypothetical protein
MCLIVVEAEWPQINLFAISMPGSAEGISLAHKTAFPQRKYQPAAAIFPTEIGTPTALI